jgi:hypothetical protein
MARELCHPPPPAGRAEPAPLARERDEQVERAARTTHPTEAVREVSAGDDGAQLLLDEGRQSSTAVLVSEPQKKRLEMRP